MPPRGKPGRPKRPAPAGRARPTKLASGRYSIQVPLGTDAGGKRVRVRVSGDTPEEVREKRDALLARHKAGALGPDPVADRQTMTVLLRAWLEGKDGTIAFSSWERYRLAIELHLIPYIGNLRAGALTADDLRRAYRALARPKPEGRGVGPRTVQYAHLTVRQALGQAVKDGALAKNVTDSVSAPARPSHESRALTVEEAGLLLDHARGRWYTLWLLGLFTGMRQGELLGLLWPDVDLVERTVTVRRVLVRAPQNVYVLRASTKSRAGVRVIPIPGMVTEALQAHRRRQVEERLRVGPAWEDQDERVFLTKLGTSLLPSNVLRTLKRHAAESGVSGTVGVHTLRHTFASSLLAAGRPVTEVAYLLGHGSAGMTLRIYAHHVKGAEASTAEALLRYYSATSPAQAGIFGPSA